MSRHDGGVPLHRPGSVAQSAALDAPMPMADLAALLQGMAALSRVPTRRGDVLVLATSQTFTIVAVATVSADGQQDFGAGANVAYFSGLAAAVKQANALLMPGRQVYLLNIDTGDWRVMSTGHTDSALPMADA